MTSESLVATAPQSVVDARPPVHVAIIMDGNGRWAQKRGLSRIEGHRAGRDAVRRTIEACREMGISYLTLYAFSTENWGRPTDEVEGLMLLLREAIAEEAEELERNGISLRISGDLAQLDPGIAEQLQEVVARTRANDRLILNFAFNYGGRAELVKAARRVAEEVASGRLNPGEIDEGVLEQFLYTAGLPDPDLLIRTGGDQRVSNFLLWQIAYTELYFSDLYWPDFDAPHLHEAVLAYQRRRRSFGRVQDPEGGNGSEDAGGNRAPLGRDAG